MITNSTWIAWVLWGGMAVSVLGCLPYIVATVRGHASPSRVTWSIWLATSTTALIGQWLGGASSSALVLTVVAALLPLAVVVASLSRRGQRSNWTPADRICTVLGGAGLLAWWILGDSLIAVWVAVGVNAIATVPTLVGAVRCPGYERHLPYITSFVAAAATLLVIPQPWTLVDAVLPIHLAVINVAVMAAIGMGSTRRAAPSSPPATAVAA